MNYSDAERLRTVLNGAKYQETTDEKSADLIVVVACSVRQTAIDRIHGKINMWKKWQSKKPALKIILTGCVLPADIKSMKNKFDFIFNIKETAQLAKLIASRDKRPASNASRSDAGRQDTKYKQSTNYLHVVPTQTSKFSAQVPIMTGCDNFCTYCAVPFTRGREVSRPQKEIIAEVKDLIKRGYKDLTLLGQNVNSYEKKSSIPPSTSGLPAGEAGRGLGEGKTAKNFLKLIQELDKIPGLHWIRFTSNHPKDFSLDLIKFLKTSKHFAKYIHLPVQSGSDKILKAMKRPYKIADYIKLAQKIKKEIPDVCLTTDIIVGFPGETQADFEKSCDLFRKIRYDLAFISQYSPRPGTPSAKLKDNVPRAEKKRRELFLNSILAQTALEQNQKLLDKKIKVLVEKLSSDKSYVLARTSTLKTVKIFHFYHMVKVKCLKKLIAGEFAEVKITSATAWRLEGKIYA
jgi:tRNA-2-methylthio-N6-dimethylallyladenosine synthase